MREPAPRREEKGPAMTPHVSPETRLFRWLALERSAVLTILVYAVAVGIVSLAAPLGVQALVSAIAFGGFRQPLLVLTLLVLGALAFAAVLRAAQWLVAEHVQQRVFARSALEVTQRLCAVRPSALGTSHPREFVNRFFDVATIQKGAAMLLIDGVYVALQTFVGAIILAFYHPLLLAYGVALIVAIVFVLVPLGRLGVSTAVDESKAKYATVAWFEEMASQPTAFRSRAGERFAVEHARTLTEGYLDARRRHFRIVFRQGATFLVLQALATAGLLGIGGVLVLEGKITLGQLVAAELIVTSVTSAFAKFGKYLESYYDLLAALDKVGHLTDVALEASGGEPPPGTVDGGGPLLEARGVCFGEADEVLKEVSLSLNPGEHVALLGPNGAGKSAFLNVLWGIESPSRGVVSYRGAPLPQLDVRKLRDDVVLLRDADLFEGSIIENVRLGRQEIGIDDVTTALRLVGMWEEVERIPLGLGAPARRCGLSAGQVRRLLLARAIAGRPKVLLLDGILDGIDSASRQAVAAGVLGPRAPWSVVLATHDLGVAELADRIHHLDRGQIVAERAGREVRP